MTDSKLTLIQKLSAMQIEIKAPKNQYNKFGDYHYRNLEDIYEGLKPLLEKYKTALTIDNSLEVIKDIIFRKSIATLHDCESENMIQVSTYTQEALNKPKMSPEQSSGSVASYGDKYVLNKMFCIDDNKDSDTNEMSRMKNQNKNNNRNQNNNKRGQQKKQDAKSPQDYNAIVNLVKNLINSGTDRGAVLKFLEISDSQELKTWESKDLLDAFKALKEKFEIK